MDAARSLLLTVKSRIDRGEPVDAATFCSLISNEELTMTKDQWDKVTDRYFTPEQKAEFAANRRRAISTRLSIVRNGPISASGCGRDPARRRQRRGSGIVDEWQELLKPFTQVASPAMMQGVTKFYERWTSGRTRCRRRPSAPNFRVHSGNRTTAEELSTALRSGRSLCPYAPKTSPARDSDICCNGHRRQCWRRRHRAVLHRPMP